MLTQRGGDHLLINQRGNAGQKLVLGDHVPGFKHRAGEHKFPVQGDALRLQRTGIQRLGIVYQRQFALRRESLNNLRIVRCGVVQAGDVGHLFDPKRGQLFRQWLAVVDDIMRPRLPYPLLAFRARCRANNGHFRQLTRQLNQNRSHPARSTHDQQRIPFVALLLNTQAIEQHFPGGDRR